MKRYILILFSIVVCSRMAAQPLPDSVKLLYNAGKTDSEKGRCLADWFIGMVNDSSVYQKIFELSNYFINKNDQLGQDYAQLFLNNQLAMTGDYTTALNQSLQILARFQKRQDDYGVLMAYKQIGFTYYYSGDFEQAVLYGEKGIPLALHIDDKKSLFFLYNLLGTTYIRYHMPDSGLIYAQQAVRYAKEIKAPEMLSVALSTVGENYLAKKEYDSALRFIQQSVAHTPGAFTKIWYLNDFAQIFLETNHQDSARYYALLAIKISSENGVKDQLQKGYELLYMSFEKAGTADSALKYFKLSTITKDSLYSQQKSKQVQAINFREQTLAQVAEQEKIQMQNKIRTYAMLAGIVFFMLIAFVLYRNSRSRKNANDLLQHKNVEIEQQKKNVEQTLTELKSTQAQLIQSEKMASLGELTAGIAHEIQNPLNFVNNFSDVNTELIDELQEELKAGKINDAITISNDIKENEQKINHHGKRADAIVKGMLQHSQSSTGQKEPTDINALCDEYLRLSYHGLRAKDKTFNADFKTDFDDTISKINIVPQDIGRVLLNLYNNAFYAVNERKKTARDDYKPLVLIETKEVNNSVEIKVRDNGNGIPQNIADKIFQPFFTTKPTGQGTGLGLSLSYDIIKA
ncbi:MAG: ATP-binding protein, partial [Ferruginibacter sp.]